MCNNRASIFKDNKPRSEQATNNSNVMTILLVDDNVINRKTGCKIIENVFRNNEELKNIHVKIITAESAEKAIELYKSSHNIDAIIMDNEMNGIRGSEATLRIRDFEKENSLQQVYIWTYTDSETGVYPGANDRFEKPMSSADVSMKLIDFIQNNFQNAREAKSNVIPFKAIPIITHNSSAFFKSVNKLNSEAKTASAGECDADKCEKSEPKYTADVNVKFCA